MWDDALVSRTRVINSTHATSLLTLMSGSNYTFLRWFSVLSVASTHAEG